MVNYRRVLCEVGLLLAAVAYISAAPLDCKDDRVFDQRQNGSENYRLNIDGVVIAVAPAESLLSAVSDIDISDLFDLDSFNDQEQKPKPPNQVTDLLIGEEPAAPKPEEKPVPSKPEENAPEKKPEEKPQEPQPEKIEAPVKAPEPHSEKGHKKSAMQRKQENAQRLKHRLASIFLPFLRKRRHQ